MSWLIYPRLSSFRFPRPVRRVAVAVTATFSLVNRLTRESPSSARRLTPQGQAGSGGRRAQAAGGSVVVVVVGPPPAPGPFGPPGAQDLRLACTWVKSMTV
jgi:hypothetical protein